MGKIKKVGCLVVLLGLLNSVAFAKIESLININLDGGNSIYEGETSSLSGDGGIDFIPAINFSNNTALLPYFGASYQGVQQLQQLAEGGYLYQEQLDGVFSLKLLNKLDSGYVIKPNMGYKIELLKEAKDEKWFNGLYDFHRVNAGVEVEKKSESSCLNMGYNAYWFNFPNYESLASAVGFYQPGKDLFDCLINEVYVKRTSPLFKKLSIEYGNNFAYKYFIDQKKTVETTGYSSTHRYDLTDDFDLNLTYPLPEFKLWKVRMKPLTGINYEFTYNYSNQNYWEERTLVFIKGFYNYVENGVGPSLVLFFPEAISLSASYDFSLRNYTNRPIQTVSGIYGEDKINQTKQTLSVRTDFPILGGFTGYALFDWQKVSSNMKYEQFYKYNYTSGYYLAGINYKY